MRIALERRAERRRRQERLDFILNKIKADSQKLQIVATEIAQDLKNRNYNAATLINAVARGFLGRIIGAEMRLQKWAALKVQCGYRRHMAKKRSGEEKWRKVRVAPSRYALNLMRLRSKITSQRDDWIELFDTNTNTFWYLNKKTAHSTWTPPAIFEQDLFCRWDPWPHPYESISDSNQPCRTLFKTMAAFQKHRLDCHCWICPACDYKNVALSFPKCTVCFNSLDRETGHDLTLTLEKKLQEAFNEFKKPPVEIVKVIPKGPSSLIKPRDDDDDDDDDDDNQSGDAESVEDNLKTSRKTNHHSESVTYATSGSGLITQDIEELNMWYQENQILSSESSTYDNEGIKCWSKIKPGFNLIYVWILLTPERLLLNEERAFAWGLDQNLAIRIDFSNLYTEGTEIPKVSRVGLFKGEVKGDELELELSHCMLEWVIKERLGVFLKDQWPPSLTSRTTLAEVMDCTGLSRGAAETALQQCKRDQNEAINLLLEKGDTISAEVDAWDFIAPSISLDFYTKNNNSLEVKRKLLQLHQMFPTVPGKVLYETLQETAEDLSVAASKLAELVSTNSVPDWGIKNTPVSEAAAGGGGGGGGEYSGDIWGRASRWRAGESRLTDFNFLAQIVHFLEDKLRTVNERCLVCDCELDVVGMKPQACNDDLCTFRYDELGIGLSLDAEIIRSPELVDLLISFFYASASNKEQGRVGLFFPSKVKSEQKDGSVRSFIYPEGINVTSAEASEIAPQALPNVTQKKTKTLKTINVFPVHRINFTLLTHVLNLIPSIDVLRAWAQGSTMSAQTILYNLDKKRKFGTSQTTGATTSGKYLSEAKKIALKQAEDDAEAELQKERLESRNHTIGQIGQGDVLRMKLDEIDDLIYPLLRWLIATNLSHIRLLREEENFDQMSSPHNFVLLSGPAQREQTFQMLKQKHGSFFAWHGSSLGNWHVILRTSLKNMSSTKYMSAGKAYGEGIYFAANANTSLGYCTSRGPVSSIWKESIYQQIQCLALCEIIDLKEEFTHSKNGIYVVPQEHYVVTRFVMVNPKFVNSAASADAGAFVQESKKRGQLKFL